MHRHLLIWILLFCCLGVNAQQQQDTAFRKLYKQYFKLYNEPEKEKEFWETSNKVEAYYKKQGRQRSYYKMRQNEVLYLVDHGRAYQAIKRSNEILEEMKSEGAKHYDIVYTSLATVYESRGNYRMAKQYFMEALKNANAKDSGALISIYSRIASLQSTREPKEAWEWNEKFGALAKIYPDYYKMYLSQKGRISFFMLDKPKFLKAQAEAMDDQEPEIPEESRPNLTDLIESIPDDSKKDNEDRNLIHTDSDDFDDTKADEEDEDELEDLIDEGNKQDISEYYEDMQPADFVEEIDDLDDEDIGKLPELLNTEQLTEIMEEADDDTRQRIGDHLPDDTLLEMFEDMSKDDIVDILGEMEIARRKRLLNRMKSGDRKIIHTLLQYPDDSAGGIMTTEYIALREDRTCAEALDTIRDIGPKTEVIETIYVTDEDRLKKLVGTVDLRDLLSSPRNTKLCDIMDDQVVSVEPEVDQEEVAQVVSKYDLQAIPVVSSKGSILGIITVDDIIDVIEESVDVIEVLKPVFNFKAS
jgi:CBS domain-containing protein